MEQDNALGAFLRARREQVQPEDVDLPAFGRRRVPGLRREELAMLAGVSNAYYVRLEQGRDRHPSPQVLEALARALQLDESATRHLHSLAAPAPRRRRPSPKPERVRPELARLLDQHLDAPAFVFGRHLDILAANALAGALHPSFRVGRNVVRDAFLDDEVRAQFACPERAAAGCVAALRASVGADVDHPRLVELVGELSLKSDEFRRLWARHEVREKASGVKRFLHPQLGELELGYQSFAVSGADRQLLVTYYAQPGTPAERSLDLLRTLAAPSPAAQRAADAAPADPSAPAA
ncbi:helix-turn-helix transcriptional regulator [Patulibacter sp. SYSU D01012]|uniref:helix-turn-helix domain-containing protein n=1 Tax=Patulibacter sp. SYSU D01012 TaxID=2817381 RepID=UPI001B31861B|nr:helix-turn-helix transcriptional regulator [Patulibacter sp. SYSU D01012]